MAKGDSKAVKNEINTEQTAVNDRYQDLYSGLNEKRQDYTNKSNEERQYLTDQFRSSSDVTGGLDPTTVNNIRGLYGWRTGAPGSESTGGDSGGSSSGGDSGGSSAPVAAPVNPYETPEATFRRLAESGGIDMATLQTLRGGLAEIGKTGGWDSNAIAGVGSDINRLRGIASDGGFDAASRTSIQSGLDRLKTYGNTGGYDPAATDRIRGDISSLRSLWGTGGYDPAALEISRNRIGQLDTFARTGGISDEDIARFRGTGYSEFAETGGYSPEQIAELRSRSNSVIPAQFKSTMNEAGRLRNASGSNTGFLAGASRLARQSNQDAAQAARDTEIDLGAQVREGRRWGIEGQQETENELQQILSRNKIQAGLGAAQYGNELEGNVADNRRGILKDTAGLETTLEGDLAKNRLAATEGGTRLEMDFKSSISKAIADASKGAGDLQTNMQRAISESKAQAEQIILDNETKAQQLRQQGQIAGAQGLTTIAAQKAAEAARASSNASAARASSEANDRWWANFIAGNERWIGDNQQDGRMDSLRGLTSIYGMDPTLGRDNLQLSTASSWADDNRGLLGLDVQANQRQGNGILDWARFASGFIPSGGAPGTSQASVVRNSPGTGGGGSDSSYDWNSPFIDFNPTPSDSGTAPIPNVRTSEDFRFPG